MRSPIGRDALDFGGIEARELKRMATDRLNSLERTAIEAAKRLDSDPAMRAARLMESDPYWQARQLAEEKIRLHESLAPSRHMTEALRLRESIAGTSFIERNALAERVSPTPRPLPNIRPARDYHLEALNDIRRSLSAKAQQQAEGVQAAFIEHIRQKQQSLREDQELVLYSEGNGERFQVLQIRLPNHYTVILEGRDAEGNSVSRVATLNNVEITSKVVTIAPPAKPYRIGFITPNGEPQ